MHWISHVLDRSIVSISVAPVARDAVVMVELNLDELDGLDWVLFATVNAPAAIPYPEETPDTSFPEATAGTVIVPTFSMACHNWLTTLTIS